MLLLMYYDSMCDAVLRHGMMCCVSCRSVVFIGVGVMCRDCGCDDVIAL